MKLLKKHFWLLNQKNNYTTFLLHRQLVNLIPINQCSKLIIFRTPWKNYQKHWVFQTKNAKFWSDHYTIWCCNISEQAWQMKMHWLRDFQKDSKNPWNHFCSSRWEKWHHWRRHLFRNNLRQHQNLMISIGDLISRFPPKIMKEWNNRCCMSKWIS